MSETLEIQQIVEHLQGVLENLVLRGLRAAGATDRNALATLGAEFTRIGAGHLAERVLALREAIENDLRDGPERLLKTQASLRLFERILTLEVARASLEQWQSDERPSVRSTALAGAPQEGSDEPESE
jgi:hypothetical protein